MYKKMTALTLHADLTGATGSTSVVNAHPKAWSFRPRLLPLAIPATLVLLIGCSPALRPAKPTTLTSETALATVPNGINARFLAPGLDISQWTSRFEGESREVYRAREAIVEAIGLQAGHRIADVGTGTGLFVKYFSDAVGPNGHVYAVDISPSFVQHVRARAKKAGLQNVTVTLAKHTEVMLDEASIDVVFICDTYHHFEQPSATLRSIRGALRDGGRLILIDFHRIAGKTKPFLMKHVRAPREVFAKEVQDAGFTLVDSPRLSELEENYMLIFKK